MSIGDKTIIIIYFYCIETLSFFFVVGHRICSLGLLCYEMFVSGYRRIESPFGQHNE